MDGIQIAYTLFTAKQRTFCSLIVCHAAQAACSEAKIPNTTEPLPVICAPSAPQL